MSFDLHSRTDEGLSFHINNWGWRPLLEYLTDIAPETISQIRDGSPQYNDGAILETDGCRELHRILVSEINSGQAKAYIEQRDARLRAMPDEICNLCGGTGKRTDMWVANGCNKCHGTGKVRPDATFYWMRLETIQEFSEFCRKTDGFTID